MRIRKTDVSSSSPSDWIAADHGRQRMNENRTPNYGVDAPVAVRNLLIVSALGIVSLIARLLGVWSRQDVIAVIARPLMVAGLTCGAMALWMIYDSKIGKVRERETYLNKINWNGHERVL